MFRHLAALRILDEPLDEYVRSKLVERRESVQVKTCERESRFGKDEMRGDGILMHKTSMREEVGKC
jgi:hypothetical protein